MSYISNTDIQTRLGSAAYVQLTDDVGAGSANEAVVDEARLAAEGEVDSYLARRFATPIELARHPELADLLRSICLDLAEHRLRLRRPPIPAETTARRSAAVAWLERVASGEVELPASVQPESAGGGLAKRITGSERVLSREELADF